MGFRFQKRISILPGVRINLSKGGVSTSLGPRGADVNIGKDGIATNAGIPGTGLSYRQKLGGKTGGKTGLLGVLAVVGGLAFWAFQHAGKIEKAIAPAAPQAAAVTPQAASSTPQAESHAPVNTAAPSLRYVHRAGSVLRDEPKTSGHILRKESKGSQVTLVSEEDAWAKVTDGDITGYMRSSVLGIEPPK
jgi:hypothetical protein